MGQSRSSHKAQNPKNSKIINRINHLLQTQNKDLKEKVENNYSIQNYNSNSYLAYNIKKSSEGLAEIQFNWYEYAFEECKVIQKDKSYPWINDILKLLELMKKDPLVKEFQRTELLSLIFTIESMTEIDYLSQNECSFEKEFLSLRNNEAGNNHLSHRTGQSLFGNSAHSVVDSFIIDRKTKRGSHFDNLQKSHGRDATNQFPQNLKNLIEDISVFEEELQENVAGTKLDSNLMRSEIQTVFNTQHLNVLQYSERIEEMYHKRESRNIPRVNNCTILYGNPCKALQDQGANLQNSYSRERESSQEKDEFIDALKLVNFYKVISSFLDKSLQRKVNPLRAIQKLFKNHFFKKYTKFLSKQSLDNSLIFQEMVEKQSQQSQQQSDKHKIQKEKNQQNNSKSQNEKIIFQNITDPLIVTKGDEENQVREIKQIVEEMITETQQFLHLLLYCLIFFYDLDSILPQKEFSQLVNKENLWNFIINIIFADDKFQSLLLELIQQSLSENKQQLVDKFIKFKDIQPQHLEIHDKFCLNEKTIKFQFKKQNEKTDTSSKQLLTFKNQDHEEEEEKRGEESNLKQTRLPYKSLDKFEYESEDKQPFQKAILKLSNIVHYKSPIHKMKVIVECFEQIPVCIQDFYEENFSSYEGNNLIASDDLINILIYIVIKTNMPEIVSHLKFISSFLSKSSQQTKIGYYCTSLQIVSHYLESQNVYENVSQSQLQEKILKEKEEHQNLSQLNESKQKEKVDDISISHNPASQNKQENILEVI